MILRLRYASIRSMDISNGEGVGVALFVQGCPSPQCKGCFNPETWDFNGGREWTHNIKETLFRLIDRDYIKRVSILGGEPLAAQNLNDVLDLIREIKNKYSNKTVWIYSGYTWDQIMYPIVTDDFNLKRDEMIHKRREVVSLCDVLVDGRYIESQRDITLKWRGSKNQRVIDIQQSRKQNTIVLYCD